MSAFVTRIPVDISSVTKYLPPGSDVEDVTFSRESGEVAVQWSNDRLHTGYSFHEEWPLASLEKGDHPASVKAKEFNKPVEPVAAPSPEATVKPGKRKARA